MNSCLKMMMGDIEIEKKYEKSVIGLLLDEFARRDTGRNIIYKRAYISPMRMREYERPEYSYMGMFIGQRRHLDSDEVKLEKPVCSTCGQEAFIDSNGEPYCPVHHSE